jgi:hypothetical protein
LHFSSDFKDRAWVVLVMAVTGLVACSGYDAIAPGDLSTLERIAGDSQSVLPLGSSAPLIARVVDPSGAPAAGVVVRFELTTGGGTLAAEADTSDGYGLVSSVYQANATSGVRRIEAQVGSEVVQFDLAVTSGGAVGISLVYGQEQGGPAGDVLLNPLRVLVEDAWGNGVAGEKVAWAVVGGDGTVGSDTTMTNAAGIAEVVRTLGPDAGGQLTRTIVVSASDTFVFHSTARKPMAVLGGGNNVPDRCTGNLSVQGQYGYSATWKLGGCPSDRLAAPGVPLFVWDLSGADPVLVDSTNVGVGNITDLEVSADGQMLLATASMGFGDNTDGLYLYSLADPAHPVAIDSQTNRDPQPLEAGPLLAGTFADIGGERYVFAARAPTAYPPALNVYRIQPDSADRIRLVQQVDQEPGTSLVDLVVRDGLLFAAVGVGGLRIYDVGDGRVGGSPGTPILIVTVAPTVINGFTNGVWWYHDANGGTQYLFVSELSPSTSEEPGMIHVVDVSTMAEPVEVARFQTGARFPRELWTDEARGILYAIYGDKGVLAIDVTGTLTGDLTTREIGRLQPGGAVGWSWDVKVANGRLLTTDMLTGLWQVTGP